MASPGPQFIGQAPNVTARSILLWLSLPETAAMVEHDELREFGDRVVIRRVDAEEKSAGGIIIPDTARSPRSHRPMPCTDDAAGIYDVALLGALQHWQKRAHGNRTRSV